MGAIKTFFRNLKMLTFKKKGSEPAQLKEAMKQNITHPWTVYYGANTNSKDGAKRYMFVHYIAKYLFVTPALELFHRFSKKYHYKVQNEWHNTNLALFDKVFDKTIEEWNFKWIHHSKHLRGATFSSEEEKKKWMDEQMEFVNTSWIRKVKDISFMFVGQDSAYLEFFNMLTYNWGKEINNHYKDKPEINHVLYSAKHVYDVNYYHIGKDFFNNDFVIDLSTGNRFLVRRDVPNVLQQYHEHCKAMIENLRLIKVPDDPFYKQFLEFQEGLMVDYLERTKIQKPNPVPNVKQGEVKENGTSTGTPSNNGKTRKNGKKDERHRNKTRQDDNIRKSSDGKNGGVEDGNASKKGQDNTKRK